jgi:hypothetical protein
LMWQEFFLHETQWITPLLLWNTWNKKKTPNTLHENNPLSPMPNVCVPEVFNYTDFTKLAILSSDTKKLGIHCSVGLLFHFKILNWDIFKML